MATIARRAAGTACRGCRAEDGGTYASSSGSPAAARRAMEWGTSVLASALAAGLAMRNDLRLVQVEATLEAALGSLRRRPAHAVVCDLVPVPAAWVLRLLEAYPRLAVVIVDFADGGMVVTWGRCSMRTLDDLLAALMEGAGERDTLVPGTVERTP